MLHSDKPLCLTHKYSRLDLHITSSSRKKTKTPACFAGALMKVIFYNIVF